MGMTSNKKKVMAFLALAALFYNVFHENKPNENEPISRNLDSADDALLALERMKARFGKDAVQSMLAETDSVLNQSEDEPLNKIGSYDKIRSLAQSKAESPAESKYPVTQEIDPNGPPIMNTFYEPVVGGCCGMSEEGHANLLRAWKDTWEQNGWQTRILTEADARKHPDFELLDEKLAAANVTPYNRRCFWRWLAMSTPEINGGWMSDYDTIPLSLHVNQGMRLQEDPGFKSYDTHIPDLIHASRESWDHVTDLMIRSIPQGDLPAEVLVTDMHMLQFLYIFAGPTKMGITHWGSNVARGFPYSPAAVEGGQPEIDCDEARLHLAAHLSHHDVIEARNVLETYPNVGFPDVPDTEEITMSVEKRGPAARRMVADMEICRQQAAEQRALAAAQEASPSFV